MTQAIHRRPSGSPWSSSSVLRRGRCARAGLDAQVVEVPSGVDGSYFQCAPRDPWVSALQGNAVVVLEGFHAERPRIQSALPDARVAGAMYGLDDADPDAPRRLAFHADGLHVDADRLLCTITWRAHVDLRDLAQRERLMVVAGVGIRSATAAMARAPSPPAAAPSLPVAVPMPPVAPAPAAAPSPSVAAGAAPLEEPVPIERYAAVVAELADKGALRSKVLSEARRGSAANEHSRREPHAPIGPPRRSPWKRSEIVRDRPRESSLARDVLGIARVPWRARRARSRRPAATVCTDSSKNDGLFCILLAPS
ncbi:DUF2169 domain-containing protein [Sorangium sp. So ce887]|uniref:DUF2169 domain-containing protein n=1 Tax=Sorangium sp. So ce887 TaxID=3133324 RepID=UPI003F60EF75